MCSRCAVLLFHRVLKSRLRALEEKIEADLEESVFVKYELEDVRAEYEHLKQVRTRTA